MIERWQGWFDGATNPNPGERGIGGVLKGPAGQRIEIAEAIGWGSNNEAEYAALIAVLDAAITAQVQAIDVYGDSQLVIKQVSGEWLINAKGLVPLCRSVLDLMVQIPSVKLHWVPRDQNVEADALSKRALGVSEPAVLDRTVWMKISEIAKPYGLSGIALGKKLDLAKFRANGKPTALALEKGLALRVPNHFGHDDFWHRKLLPAALREIYRVCAF